MRDTENLLQDKESWLKELEDKEKILEEVRERQGKEKVDFEIHWNSDPDIQATLHSLQQPELPESLSPCQAAQLSELVEYMHLRVGDLLTTAKSADEEGEQMLLEQLH